MGAVARAPPETLSVQILFLVCLSKRFPDRIWLQPPSWGNRSCRDPMCDPSSWPRAPL